MRQERGASAGSRELLRTGQQRASLSPEVTGGCPTASVTPLPIPHNGENRIMDLLVTVPSATFRQGEGGTWPFPWGLTACGAPLPGH